MFSIISTYVRCYIYLNERIKGIYVISDTYIIYISVLYKNFNHTHIHTYVYNVFILLQSFMDGKQRYWKHFISIKI